MSKQTRLIFLFMCTMITWYPHVVFAMSMSLNEGLTSLAQDISSEMEAASMYRIAITDFNDLNGNISELGVFISEELTTRLHDTQKFKLVERRMLYKVIEEQKLGRTGILDETSVKQIGKILGVNGLCTGTITDLDDSFKVNARVISVETGQIYAVASVEINKNDAIRLLMRKFSQARMDAERLKPRTSRPEKTNLLTNGGFSNECVGWKRSIGDINQGVSKTEIVNWKYSASGRMLHLSHKGNGSIQLAQVVPVPSADLILSMTFQMHTHEGLMRAFSGTGIVQVGLQYLDHNGAKLGQTILLNYVRNPFADTPLIGIPRRESDTYTTHYIEVSPDKLYSNYRLDIRKEIESNLLGIDHESVEEIAMIVWCGATNPNAGADLWITDISLSYK